LQFLRGQNRLNDNEAQRQRRQDRKINVFLEFQEPVICGLWQVTADCYYKRDPSVGIMNGIGEVVLSEI